MTGNKVDEGFELIYWNLSYRRKFIRTLWMIPFCTAVLVFIWFINSNSVMNTILTTFCIVVFLIQLIYTYSRWKKDEHSP
ncbi:hypothetical protein [uncultured Clostridium sp.]|uniref:hypothetical protein n=1 Tax=uncultured Clostridium sp. TaxID=59620 RepID=UPI0028EE3EC8|nr:hypothetical protein [uncultured Clostridium sp.]